MLKEKLFIWKNEWVNEPFNQLYHPTTFLSLSLRAAMRNSIKCLLKIQIYSCTICATFLFLPGWIKVSVFLHASDSPYIDCQSLSRLINEICMKVLYKTSKCTNVRYKHSLILAAFSKEEIMFTDLSRACGSWLPFRGRKRGLWREWQGRVQGMKTGAKQTTTLCSKFHVEGSRESPAHLWLGLWNIFSKLSKFMSYEWWNCPLP